MIYDTAGRRKYLTINERRAFIAAAQRLPSSARTFCLTLAYTGARISEVLALTPQRFDMEAGVVIIESLKKRRLGVYRAVPIPKSLLVHLDEVHGIETAQVDPLRQNMRLWTCSRTTAWTVVKRAMYTATIPAARAMPKALRHAFGVGATQANVPLNIIQRWMGHSRLTTTAIYADAIGEEERLLAKQMWSVASMDFGDDEPSGRRLT